ncbi:hypothetical protein HanRHA438_Chr13g0615981 [Helianthus annuus]|nr:hypothetical protein HanRHA438_Chr13g0615981 [Helianthus annuus]
MLRIILKYTPSSTINQNQPLFTTHISKSQRTNNISSNSLHFVRLTPVNVRPAGDSGSVEHVGRVHGGNVGDEGGA